jgi:hypothetical protein
VNSAAEQPETLSFAGFARLLGIKPQAITALRYADRLVLTADGKRVQVAASQQRIRDTADPSKAGVVARHAAERAAKATPRPDTAPVTPAPDAGAGDDDSAAEAPTGNADYQSSRARREHYQALEAQRAYEVAMGKLMDAHEVASAVASAAATLRTRLESLPDVLGPQLAAISDEAQARATLAEAIEHALEETSRQFANIARQVTA